VASVIEMFLPQRSRFAGISGTAAASQRYRHYSCHLGAQAVGTTAVKDYQPMLLPAQVVVVCV
jgi:hypothetical protein